MSAMFDREQLEWLQAMGHEVMALASAGAARDAVPDAMPTSSAAPARERGASSAGPTQTFDDSPLMRALMRACAGDADCLRRLGVVATALRDDAAAKRALWPALRAARRARRA